MCPHTLASMVWLSGPKHSEGNKSNNNNNNVNGDTIHRHRQFTAMSLLFAYTHPYPQNGHHTTHTQRVHSLVHIFVCRHRHTIRTRDPKNIEKSIQLAFRLLCHAVVCSSLASLAPYVRTSHYTQQRSHYHIHTHTHRHSHSCASHRWNNCVYFYYRRTHTYDSETEHWPKSV